MADSMLGQFGLNVMLLLAGLMSMMAVGATAFFGMSGDDDDSDQANREVIEQEGEAPGTESDDGTSIMDYAVAPDPDQGAEPAVDLDTETSQDEGTDQEIEGRDEQIIIGTDGADTLEGSDKDDLTHGYNGDDEVSGGAGEDQLFGGQGDDTLVGGDGDDTLHGGDDTDLLQGGAGTDLMFGHSGDDSLEGDAGDDSLVGSDGDDTLNGGDGNDALHGDIGNDSLTGGAGQDTLFGGWGDDTLSGVEVTDDADDEDSRDYLNGGGGNDVIAAGAGDIVTTGEGNDTVVLGPWLSHAHQAEIMDFEAEEDALLILYDDATDPDPVVGLEEDEDDSTRQHVTLNGVRIAVVNNAEGLNLSHVTLLGESMFNLGQSA